MAVQLSTTVRNARLDTIESTIGSTLTLSIWTGAQPADCATANSGTLLVLMTLPADWMAAAASGAKAKSGTWEDASADGTGVAGHFRIHVTDTCHLQGSCGEGTGDLQLDNTDIATSQQVTITAFTLTDGNS